MDQKLGMIFWFKLIRENYFLLSKNAQQLINWKISMFFIDLKNYVFYDIFEISLKYEIFLGKFLNVIFFCKYIWLNLEATATTTLYILKKITSL